MNALTSRILVLNYNGKELLREFLPSVVQAAKKSSFQCRVSVVDNQSQDGSEEFVKNSCPEAEVFYCKENKVLCSYNDAARHYTEDILIFLNNDIKPEPDFVDPLIDVFLKKNDALFAATYGDKSLPRLRWGVLSADIYYLGFENDILREGHAFSAGIGAFDRKKFLELGGYDTMYLPGYYEDVDLCYRGWKRGYCGYYAPRSRQFHVGGASFNKKYSARIRQQLVFRNSLLFMMKNVTDAGLTFNFLAFLAPRLLMAVLTGKWFMLGGFADALKKMPLAFSKRREAKKNVLRKDREILGFFKEAR